MKLLLEYVVVQRQWNMRHKSLLLLLKMILKQFICWVNPSQIIFLFCLNNKM